MVSDQTHAVGIDLIMTKCLLIARKCSKLWGIQLWPNYCSSKSCRICILEEETEKKKPDAQIDNLNAVVKNAMKKKKA